jgi:hypothetical protein
VIVVMGNTSDQPQGVSILVDHRTIKATLPPKTFSTFSIPPIAAK